VQEVVIPETPIKIETPPPEPAAAPVPDVPMQTPEIPVPIVEAPQPAPAPLEVPSPTIEPVVETAPQAPAPLKQEAPAVVDEEKPVETPPTAPATHDPEITDGIPKKVLDLTPQELDAARRLWAREHLPQAQKKANESRHARMLERMKEIEKVVKANPNTTVHEVANNVGLSEKLTSGYLQKLVHADRISASGHTNNRRFSL
jgi:hypothetical protein